MRTAIYCGECTEHCVKVPVMQAHLIADHGQATRVCLQGVADGRLLGSEKIRLDAPRAIAKGDRKAALAAFKKRLDPELSCALCNMTTYSYHTLKRHLANEHKKETTVCLARAYDNVLVTRCSAEGKCGVVTPDPAESAAPAAAAAEGSGTAEDPDPESPAKPLRTTRFGLTNVLPPPEKTAAEKAAEAAEIAAFINRDKEKAYACPDDGPNRHYEAFEAGRTVPEMQSLWRDARGHPLFTHYREDDTPIAFYYEHVSMEEMIDVIKTGIPQAFTHFILQLLDDPRNRLFYKRSPSYPLTDVHFGDGVWKICRDEHVYPRFVENAALAMRSLLGRFMQNRCFIAAFNGKDDYNTLDHHMYIVCRLFHCSDLEAYYDRDMKHWYYGYIGATRAAVAEYSETEEEPWNAYPVGGGGGAAASST